MTMHTKAADWRRAAVVTAAGLLVAAGVVPTATPAAAQYRRENDGRALDANKRLGSDGRNEGSPYSNGYSCLLYTSPSPRDS